MVSPVANTVTSLLTSTPGMQQALKRPPVSKLDAEQDTELAFLKSPHQCKKRAISHTVGLPTMTTVQHNLVQAVPAAPVMDSITSLPDAEYQQAVSHLIVKTMSQLPPLPGEGAMPIHYSSMEKQLTQGLQLGVTEAPTSKPLQQGPVYDFTFSDIFAGTSSFSEHSVPGGAIPISYIEWENLDRLILRQHSEDAKIFGDFYKQEWSKHNLVSDVIVAWPMCRHLSNAGRRKMHLDSVASQVVDILPFVQQFCKYLVIYENVSNLVILDEEHGILSDAIKQYDSKGWVFGGIIWMDDDVVGGRSNRLRPLVVSDEQSVSWKIPILDTRLPSMDAVEPLSSVLEPPHKVSHLKLEGVFTAANKLCGQLCIAGYLVLSTERPYQPGVHVKLKSTIRGNTSGWYVVYEDRGDQVYLRSLNRKSPYYYTVCQSEIARASGNNMSKQYNNTGKPHCVWDPDHKLPTMRSLPDPFGNCAILDRNFKPPIVRPVSPVEVWRIQTRSEDVVDMLAELDATSIVPTAGKALTGQMQAALCPIIQLRVEQARATEHPVAPCRCATPDSYQNSGFFVIIHLLSGTVLLAAKSTMIPAKSVQPHRESAVKAAETFMKKLCMISTPFLAGVDGLRMVLACPVSERETKVDLNSFNWCPFTEIMDTQMRSLVSVALIRCGDLAIPKINRELTHFVTGNLRSLLVPYWARPDTRSWPQHTHMVHRAVQCLKSAYDKEIKRLGHLKGSFSCGLTHGFSEAVASDQIGNTNCPCLLESGNFIAALSAWRDRIVNFTEESIPKALRNFIPDPEDVGLTIPFPVPHLAVVTKWLPLSPKQEPFARKMSSWSEGIGDDRWSKLNENIKSVDRWVTIPDAKRPREEIIWGLVMPTWWPRNSLGLPCVLDGRKMKTEGIVTELDFEQKSFTLLNTGYISEALKGYPDQELRSFLVLGSSYKAQVQPAWILCKHLLSLKDCYKEVAEEILKLEDLNMIEVFEEPPFFPGRFNGKGAVAKPNGDLRPLENGGDPTIGGEVYKDDLRVYSLNDLIKGFDNPDCLDADGLFNKTKSPKWPKERKPSTADVRRGQSIIRSGAAAANVPTYMASADLWKYFNQFFLRAENLPNTMLALVGKFVQHDLWFHLLF